MSVSELETICHRRIQFGIDLYVANQNVAMTINPCQLLLKEKVDQLTSFNSMRLYSNQAPISYSPE